MKEAIVITPTGGRPEAFAICEKFIARQTHKNITWIVVDDCDPPTKTTLPNQFVIRPAPRWKLGDDTQCRNLICAVNFIQHIPDGVPILIMEDDDWFSPTYVETMVKLLDKHELAGEGSAIYYNLPNRMISRLGNFQHAALTQTGFRSELLPLFKRVLEKQPRFIDDVFWKEAKLRGADDGLMIDVKNPMVIGIKGLPGRPGLAWGHAGAMNPGTIFLPDDNMHALALLIGEEDANMYARTVPALAKEGVRYATQGGIRIDTKIPSVKDSEPGIGDLAKLLSKDIPEHFRKSESWKHS